MPATINKKWVVIFLIGSLFLLYFVFRGYDVRNSDAYETATSSLRKEYSSAGPEDFNLLSYQKSQHGNEPDVEYMHFKIETSDGKAHQIKLKKADGHWAVVD
jgi:hypothetical protein